MSLVESQANFDMPEDRKEQPKLDELTADRIGKKLRDQFDEILNEPVPDRFVQLLNQLEAAEKKPSKDSDHE